jgi:hypothetical protein
MSVACEKGDLCLLSAELVVCLARAFAHRLAGGQQLASSALGERLGTHATEHLVRGAQMFARVQAPVLAPEPLAAEQVGR